MMDPNPTSPLQQLAIAINFFFPSLALLVLGLRIYGKVWSKCPGPGTFRHPSTLWGPGRFHHLWPSLFDDVS